MFLISSQGFRTLQDHPSGILFYMKPQKVCRKERKNLAMTYRIPSPGLSVLCWIISFNPHPALGTNITFVIFKQMKFRKTGRLAQSHIGYKWSLAQLSDSPAWTMERIFKGINLHGLIMVHYEWQLEKRPRTGQHNWTFSSKGYVCSHYQTQQKHRILQLLQINNSLRKKTIKG